MLKVIAIILLLNTYTLVAQSNETHMAVASNFLNTSTVLSKNFEKLYKCKILISSDSTANLFTKIKNLAPFNIYISADKKHVKLFEKRNFFKKKKTFICNRKNNFFKKK